MKLSFKSIVCFSLIAVLIIVIFINTYHPREGWRPNNGKDYYDHRRGRGIGFMPPDGAWDGTCDRIDFKYRVEGTETNGKKSVRCYERPGKKKST